jgi:hypothetical protein
MEMIKGEITNPKHPIPNKHPHSIYKGSSQSILNLGIGIWDLSGVGKLGFGI